MAPSCFSLSLFLFALFVVLKFWHFDSFSFSFFFFDVYIFHVVFHRCVSGMAVGNYDLGWNVPCGGLSSSTHDLNILAQEIMGMIESRNETTDESQE